MACGSCGQSRVVANQQQAESLAAGTSRPEYIVTSPEGEVQTFSDYGLAAIHRRSVNGTMTTTTAMK